MWISHVTVVNWGNIPNGEYPMGRINLFCGGSGTGKTTLGDALQTILTGAKHGLYSYNPGQDESNQYGKKGKTPRTLQSYALGAEEGNIFSRPKGSHSYVAATFISDPKETHSTSFTAVVGVSARLSETGNGVRSQRSAVEEDLCLMVIDGQELHYKDFFGYLNDPERVIPVEDAYNAFKRVLGEGCIYCPGRHKENYLKRLYGRLRGAKTAQGNEHLIAAKAFSRFMAYKPIEGVSDFVREQILEPKEEMAGNVEKISRLMTNVFELRAEAKRLDENILSLKQARRFGEAWKRQYHGIVEARYVDALVEELLAKKFIEDSEGKIIGLEKAAEAAKRFAEESIAEVSRLNEEVGRVSGERSSNQVAMQKDKLEESFSTAVLQYTTHRASAAKGIRTASATLEILKEAASLQPEIAGHPIVAKQVSSLVKIGQSAAHIEINRIAELLNRLLNETNNLDRKAIDELALHTEKMDSLLSRTFRVANKDEECLRDQASKLYDQLDRELTDKKKRMSELTLQINNLERLNTVKYPDGVDIALKAIAAAFPDKTAPAVLCDLIEVRNPDWQSPIEAYIGGNRFNIVADESIEGAAADIVLKLGKQARNVKVVQGALSRSDAERLPDIPNSIMTELVVSNRAAHAYLKASYGQVVKVKTMEELAKTRRGLMVSGMGSGGYTMFQCNIPDDRLVFGQGARLRALASLKGQLAMASDEEEVLADLLSGVGKLVALSRGVGEATVEVHVNEMAAVAKRIEKIQESIANLDLSSIEEIDRKLTELRVSQVEAQKRFRDNTAHHTSHLKDIDVLNLEVHQKTDELVILTTNVVNARQELIDVSQFDADYKFSDRQVALSAEAANQLGSGGQDAESFTRSENYRKRRGEFVNQILDYNKIARQTEQIPLPREIHADTTFGVEAFARHMGLLVAVDQQIRSQEGIGLAEANASLEDAQKDVQDIFTSDFCTMILGAIKEGQGQLDKLTLELKGHTFGDDRFEFASEWVPAYQKYYRFFKAVAELKNVGEGDSLFEADLTDEQKEARDEIVGLLTCEASGNTEKDIAVAKKRLEEIADYRNYKTYEIYKCGPNGTNALSEYGTGSGGQLETPAYVVRSASITSAFRFGPGRQSLKVLLIDESFSKCDEFRAKQVIKYLADSLGIQVIFIMPTKSAGPFLDIIDRKVVFSKIYSPETAHGELKTVVHVDRQKVNQELVVGLWDRHRTLVAQQAAINFDQVIRGDSVE